MSKSKSAKQRKLDGKVIRLSKEVLDLFERDSKESFDQAFRRKLGLTGKTGQQPESYWLLTKPRLRVFTTRANALGASIMTMVSKGNKKKERPKKVVVLK